MSGTALSAQQSCLPQKFSYYAGIILKYFGLLMILSSAKNVCDRPSFTIKSSLVFLCLLVCVVNMDYSSASSLCAKNTAGLKTFSKHCIS